MAFRGSGVTSLWRAFFFAGDLDGDLACDETGLRFFFLAQNQRLSARPPAITVARRADSGVTAGKNELANVDLTCQNFFVYTFSPLSNLVPIVRCSYMLAAGIGLFLKIFQLPE